MKANIKYNGQTVEAVQTTPRIWQVKLKRAVYRLMETKNNPGIFFMMTGTMKCTGEYFRLSGDNFMPVQPI